MALMIYGYIPKEISILPTLFIKEITGNIRCQEQPGQYLFYYNHKSGKTEPVDTTFQRPNGIVGTGDGKYLFVADIGADKTYRYEIQADGKLSDKTVICSTRVRWNDH